jgi:hypothetical protein
MKEQFDSLIKEILGQSWNVNYNQQKHRKDY